MKTNGIVYIIRRADGWCKIGYTYDMGRRMSELRGEYGELYVVHKVATESPQDLERYLHKEFWKKRDGLTEWFLLDDGDVQRIRMIKTHVHRVTFWEAFRGFLRWVWGI
jgi:hypothetical protein